MFKTEITEMFGCEYPFIGGTMMHISTPEWVAAVGEAGGVGVLASVMYKTRESFRDALKKIRDNTDKPFAVNLNLFPIMQGIDNNIYMDVILDENVKIVETSGGRSPDDIIARLKPAGIKLMHKCVGVRYAQKAEAAGVDIVTAVGFENGGATGMLDITTLCLVPSIVNAVRIPVIAGGGVVTGKAASAVMALGAEGVIMGTRLLCTEECPLHDNIKKALLAAKETDTVIILRPYQNTHRCLQNEVTRKVVEMEKRNAPIEEVIPMILGEENLKQIREGMLDRGFLSCGQGIGQVDRIMPVREVFSQMAEEIKEVNSRLGRIVG